jgi:hypothetical protein
VGAPASARDLNGSSPQGGVPGRRTVTIRGHGADRSTEDVLAARRARAARQSRPRHERAGFKPDRVAMWAVLLGIVLVLVAATSSHAATISHPLPPVHAITYVVPTRS